MIISITELRFETIIGLLEFERVTPQEVLIECFIDYKYENDYIDYALVVELIQSTMLKEKFELIETALIVLVNEIKSNFPISQNIKLSIAKPNIMGHCQVAVSHEKSFL